MCLRCLLGGGIWAIVASAGAGNFTDDAAARDDPPLSAPSRPHIVLIVADDLGWNDVGYHASQVPTPTLDTLASSGVRLERFYVLPLCTPTRAALLTGRYPIRYGLQRGVIKGWDRFGLPPQERTLAEALRDAGYRTVICGKWHLGHARQELLPGNQGFEHQYGPYLGAIDYFTHEYTQLGGLDWHRDQQPLREQGYATDLITQEAVRVILEHDTECPLFLYVPYTAPHRPVHWPPGALPGRYEHLVDWELRRMYAAMVERLDEGIGRIVQALRWRGMFEQTLLVFLSDNGAEPGQGGSNFPLRGGKDTLYEGGIRVPTFVVWPGTLQPGVCRQRLHVVDLYPTLLRAAGATLRQPLPLDGQSIWPALRGYRTLRRRTLLINVNSVRGAMIQGRWKIIFETPEGDDQPQIELYDLVADPHERNNLASDNRDVVRRLMARLRQFAREAHPPLKRAFEPPQGFERPAVWEPTQP